MSSPNPIQKLDRDFYARDTLTVARELLGMYLVHRRNGVLLAGRIIETEAYCGPHDLACHASKGRTARTDVMFGPAGHWYVYLIYGMYHCLNIVTEDDGYPAAVLIRGVVPAAGLCGGLKTDGPGKLCRAMEIDRTLNRADACGPDPVLWVEDRGKQRHPVRIISTPRIGIGYAGEYRDKPWRFIAAS